MYNVQLNPRQAHQFPDKHINSLIPLPWLFHLHSTSMPKLLTWNWTFPPTALSQGAPLTQRGLPSVMSTVMVQVMLNNGGWAGPTPSGPTPMNFCPLIKPNIIHGHLQMNNQATLLKKIKGTWSAPSLVCGHSQVQLLEDMHNCTSLKSLMFKKQLTLLAMSLTQPWHLFKG